MSAREQGAGCGCLIVLLLVLGGLGRSCSNDGAKNGPGVPAGHARNQQPKVQQGPTKKIEQVREEEPETTSTFESQFEKVPAKTPGQKDAGEKNKP